MSFYLQIILAFLLVVFPAYVKLKTDKGKPFYRALFISALGGAILSLVTNINSHRSASQNAQIAKENDSLYKDLLKQNLQSAYKIIDSLDTSISTSRIILKRSSNILGAQEKSALLLNDQSQNTYKTLFEMYRNVSLFNDFKMTLQIHYDIGGLGIYNNSGDLVKSTADILDFAKYRMNSDTIYFQYDLDGNQFIQDGNTRLLFDSKGNIDKIVIKHPDIYNPKKYESFIPVPSEFKIKFYKQIYTGGSEAENYNRNLPDLIMEIAKSDEEIQKLTCDEITVYIQKGIVEESFVAYMNRSQDNNKIRSAVDLNGAYLIFYNFKPQLPKYDYVRLDYGSQYSSSIEIEAHKIIYDIYKFPNKDVEVLKQRRRE